MTRFLLLLSSSSLFAKGLPNDNFENAHELTGDKYSYSCQGSLTDRLDRFLTTRKGSEPDQAGIDKDLGMDSPQMISL